MDENELMLSHLPFGLTDETFAANVAKVLETFETPPIARVRHSSMFSAFLCCFLFMVWTQASAQRSGASDKYFGFKTTFGTQWIAFKSDIPEINGLHSKFNGCSIGAVAENRALSASVTFFGLYYSGDDVPRTINLITSDAAVSLFPFPLINLNPRVQPYFFAGLSLARLKFYGHYMQQDSTNTINYSAPEPLLGRRKTLSVLFGGGIDYRFQEYELLHLFIDASISKPIHAIADPTFEKTSFRRTASIQIGVVFGSKY